MSVKTLVCIECPQGCSMEAGIQEGKAVVTGNKCPRGVTYAQRELVNPCRTLTTTVRTCFPDFPLLPVRTDGEVPLESIFEIMQVVNTIIVKSRLQPGDIVLEDLPGSEVALIATDDMRVRRNWNDQKAAAGN